MTARFEVECPKDGAFLVAWVKFPNGTPAYDSRGRHETWRLELVGYEHDIGNMGSPLPGDERHERLSIMCTECARRGNSYRVVLKQPTVEKYIYPALCHLDRTGGTITTRDLHKFVHGAVELG